MKRRKARASRVSTGFAPCRRTFFRVNAPARYSLATTTSTGAFFFVHAHISPCLRKRKACRCANPGVNAHEKEFGRPTGVSSQLNRKFSRFSPCRRVNPGKNAKTREARPSPNDRRPPVPILLTDEAESFRRVRTSWSA